MKKVFTIFCFSLMFMAAQEVSAQAEIDKGNLLLNAGFGAGYYGAGGLPIMLNAEWALNDAISVGPYLGITSWSDRYSWGGYGYKYKYTFVDFGGRFSYHLNKHLNLSTDKLDLYGTAMLGYTIVSASYEGYNFPGGDPDPDVDSSLMFGVVGGARWYFSDRFAANAEVGYGVTPLYLGITLKL
jgi:hypothetical protein